MAKKPDGADVAAGPHAFPPRIAFKGRLHSAYNRKFQTWVARSWPKGNGGPTPARLRAQEQFRQMVAGCKLITGAQQQACKELAAKTTFTWRDIAQMAATGRLWYLYDENGKLWMGWRMADQTIQVLLDSIYNIPGGIIVRGPDRWLMLLPPTDAKVLTFDPAVGIPQWGNAPADIQTELDSITSEAGMMLIRGATSWVQIDPSSLADIQTLLDSLGSDEGDVIVRGPSGWEVLVPGTAGWFLKTNGAGAIPAWASAAGAGYIAGNVPQIVQFAHVQTGAASVTFANAPASGNLLVALCWSPTVSGAGSGWTRETVNSSGTDFGFVTWKVAGASEPALQSPVSGAGAAGAIMCYEVTGQNATQPIAFAQSQNGNSANYSLPVMAPMSKDALALQGVAVVSTPTIIGVLNEGTRDVLDNSGARRLSASHGDLSTGPGAGSIAIFSALAQSKGITVLIRS